MSLALKLDRVTDNIKMNSKQQTQARNGRQTSNKTTRKLSTLKRQTVTSLFKTINAKAEESSERNTEKTRNNNNKNHKQYISLTKSLVRSDPSIVRSLMLEKRFFFVSCRKKDKNVPLDEVLSHSHYYYHHHCLSSGKELRLRSN